MITIFDWIGTQETVNLCAICIISIFVSEGMRINKNANYKSFDTTLMVEHRNKKLLDDKSKLLRKHQF